MYFKHYTILTKHGEIREHKRFIVDRKSKKAFSGRIAGEENNTRVERLVENGNIVIFLIYYPQAETKSNYISIEQTLHYLIIYKNEYDTITYIPFCKTRLFSKKDEAFVYAEENNIPISEDGYFTVFIVRETIKGVLVKETLYFYDDENNGEFVFKTENIFSKNLEDTKEIKVINEKVNI
ncbi:MAG: hypothetical protein ACTTJX_07515 [Fusobacterium sp.]|uniref:hypothetical protein n=1 Tax=Fusobacterium sp. TaxID=68766 RepID=UPI003F9F60DD